MSLKAIYIPNLSISKSLEPSEMFLGWVFVGVMCKPILVFSYFSKGLFQKGLGSTNFFANISASVMLGSL